MSQVAIVTGASRGIGKATALRLAREGFDVAITARSQDSLAAAAAEIETEGSRCLTVTGDLTETDTQAAIRERVITQWGRVDVLVNNAGLMYPDYVTDASINDWEAMIQVNFTALTTLTKRLLPDLRETTGHVVNVSSVAGRVTKQGYSVYAGTKHAVNAFSEGLRQEFADDGLRVTLIEPGIVDTDLYRELPESEFKRKATEWLAENRPLDPERIADTVAYVVNQPEHVNIDELLLRPVSQTR